MSNFYSQEIVQHEEDFFFSHSKLPFTAYIYEEQGSLLHWHTYIELLYIIDGVTDLLIGTNTYKAYPGDLYLINSNEIHKTKKSDSLKSFRHLVIQFEPSVIYPNLTSLFELKYLLAFLRSKTDSSIYINSLSNQEIHEIIEHILDEYENRKTGYEIEIKGSILRIFAWLIRNSFLDKFDNKDMNNLIAMKDLLHYIQQNYQERITLIKASSMVFMSPSHFCRAFRQATGKSFIAYLNFIRLNEAEKQLVFTDNSILEIAQNVGFENVTYFNRLFKNEHGVTPSELRKQKRSSFV